MSSALELIIQVGHDIRSCKYYGLGVCTILFYDYLLTLGDEVKYAWSGKKSWAFWVFISNRYLVMLIEIWMIVLIASPPSILDTRLCAKTAWFHIFSFVISTLFAQVVLTARMYAISRKNIPITAGFAAITASQLGLGLYLVIWAGRMGAQPPIPIPIEAYQYCVFYRNRTVEIAYTSISLCFDFLAFSLIIILVRNSKVGGFRIRTIMDTIAEDATRYFLVIFTSHFVLVMTLNLGRETIQLIPAPGNVVFLTVMISRLMISLWKAGDPENWSSEELSGVNTATVHSLKFRRPPRPTLSGGDVPLDTRPESHVEVGGNELLSTGDIVVV